MSSLTWSNIWNTLAVLATVGLVGLVAYGAFQDHTVKSYYMSDHGLGQSHTGYCIDGYRNWWINESGVFCSDDIEKTIGVMHQLNDSLKGVSR